ncbi:histone-lysine N-methyltransferase SUV39H2-like [Daktulosphaira vitifoliae]|uniref:histone-lysine N-methyltransferase SUV39H2-like n=1 Tax=Daktulosphaira vitifoliae TaxID=58002 RepID=UPI0021AA43B2|nr:histone-lysine N-methyltransferase SUV39H2-like [Daktulosphaira vitifoliae]
MHKGVADNEYEIENILFDEMFGNKVMYLVKWKNYPMAQCTWEPYRNLTNCQEILNDYKLNKIVIKDMYNNEKFKKLYDALRDYTEQEVIQLLQNFVDSGLPAVEEQFVKSTIGYLSTVPVPSRSKGLMKVARDNLMLIEVNKRRQRQLERIEKWQTDINQVCGFNLSVVNNVDFEGPPKKFIYVNECVAGNGVTIPDDPPVWCDCDIVCGGKKRKRNGCHFNDSQIAYNKFKRLVVPIGTPIYECNKKCNCDSSCINRVVQHGPSKNLKLQIFRTHNHRGWGVKTLVPIKQGSYVSKYTGEVITSSEAERRANTNGQKSTYMFDLDYNTDKNDCVYSVDATIYGNVSHFINHSCDSNLAIYAVWIDCLDPNLPTLALFATRDINVDEEITFNYMTQVNNKNQRIKCKCQSKNCRGYLC